MPTTLPMLMKKTVEALLVGSVSISAPKYYNIISIL